jgi:2-C-methyl-D-erythritol 4-phosphate cytidylyltransferase
VNDERGALPANWVVIPAAGRGTRFGAATPKQYLPLTDDRCVLECTLACFADHPHVAGVVVAIAADDNHWHSLPIFGHPRVRTVVGGAERADSVRNALDLLFSDPVQVAGSDWVLVHDAARPCLSAQALNRLLATLQDDPVGGILALPVSDTVKQSSGEKIAATLDRRSLWLAQTPQMFRAGLLHRALTDALATGVVITDEASAIEWAGHAPRLVPGEARNLKITHSDDLALARFYLQAGSLAGGKA